MHRFLFEDHCALHPEDSRSRARAVAKELTYRTLQRSNAWSDLVAGLFPDMVRLSIHPQPSHSPKLGILLARSPDVWLTPWHSVALDDGEQITLVRRHEAERLHASLVTRGGRPSHYVAPHLRAATAGRRTSLPPDGGAVPPEGMP